MTTKAGAKLFIVIISLLFLDISCNKIKSHNSLSDEEIQYVKSLSLLDRGETIIGFYSNMNSTEAGSFFTDKRMASYWLNEHDDSENTVEFAYYQDIKAIDTVYNAGLTYSPYMRITRNDESHFKVYAGGERAELKAFFEKAIETWRNKTKK